MTRSKVSRFSFALAGAGRVGTAVATLLAEAGHTPVAVASRSEESARRGAGRLGVEVADMTSLPEVDVLLVGASDAAIPTVCYKVAATLKQDTVVCHFAGSFGVQPLLSLAGKANLAALHPVQAFPSIDSAVERLPGSAWGVTTSAGLEEWASAVIEGDLSGRAVRVPEVFRPIWHAAAVTTANGISGLLAVSEAILDSIGIEDPYEILAPLAQGALANADEGGGGGSTLTGPIVRGEADTVARHVARLARVDDDLSQAYIDVAKVIVQAARRGGRIDVDVEMRMLRILEDL